MITEQHIIPIQLDPHEVERCQFKAREIAWPGKSHIRDTAARIISLHEDAVIGQLAQYAGSKWWGGPFGHTAYELMTWACSRVPRTGDGGFDLPGSRTDFKGSKIRRSIASKADLLGYRLAIRPRERHQGSQYILVLVEPPTEDGATAYLVGWATDDMLPAQCETTGVFMGAHTLPARELHPLPPMNWSTDAEPATRPVGLSA